MDADKPHLHKSQVQMEKWSQFKQILEIISTATAERIFSEEFHLLSSAPVTFGRMHIDLNPWSGLLETWHKKIFAQHLQLTQK